MITWSPAFETGVAVVDTDHKRLIDGLNHLELALQQGAGARKVGELLAFLEAYATNHFAREEKCMEQYRCPAAAVNKQAHAEFIAKFTQAKARIDATKGAAGSLVAMQVHADLSRWIENHVLKVDSALKSCGGSKAPFPLPGSAR